MHKVVAPVIEMRYIEFNETGGFMSIVKLSDNFDVVTVKIPKLTNEKLKSDFENGKDCILEFLSQRKLIKAKKRVIDGKELIFVYKRAKRNRKMKLVTFFTNEFITMIGSDDYWLGKL